MLSSVARDPPDNPALVDGSAIEIAPCPESLRPPPCPPLSLGAFA